MVWSIDVTLQMKQGLDEGGHSSESRCHYLWLSDFSTPHISVPHPGSHPVVDVTCGLNVCFLVSHRILGNTLLL
jgi:hypothetical protein